MKKQMKEQKLYSIQDLEEVLKFAENELKEWSNFIKLVKYKIKHKENGTNTK